MPEESAQLDEDTIKFRVSEFRKKISKLIEDETRTETNKDCLRKYLDLTLEETVRFLRQFNFNVEEAYTNARNSCR